MSFSIHEIEIDLTGANDMDMMQQQVQQFLIYMNDCRKYHEEEEEYEQCAHLRDNIDHLQKYVLDYSTIEDVEDVLLFWVQHYGFPYHAEKDLGVYIVTYHTLEPLLQAWVFRVDRPTYVHAEAFIEKRKERKKKNPGTK